MHGGASFSITSAQSFVLSCQVQKDCAGAEAGRDQPSLSFLLLQVQQAINQTDVGPSSIRSCGDASRGQCPLYSYTVYISDHVLLHMGIPNAGRQLGNKEANLSLSLSIYIYIYILI